MRDQSGKVVCVSPKLGKPIELMVAWGDPGISI